MNEFQQANALAKASGVSFSTALEKVRMSALVARNLADMDRRAVAARAEKHSRDNDPNTIHQKAIP
jgi:hypothetical protein